MPKSLILFAVTLLVFAIQSIPIVGFLMLLLLAPFWPVLLVNGGMIGIVIEALTRRVSQWWLVLPILYFGGYLALATQEHLALRSLEKSYDVENALVRVPFDPLRQSLIFESPDAGASFTHNYALPVVYTVNENFPEQHLSHRMMDSAVCEQVRETPAAQAAFVQAFGFRDGDGLGSKMASGFCALSMPEAPTLPQVRVARRDDHIRVGSLPITRSTTTVTTAGGQRVQLLGGMASPLGWIPMPVLGCGLGFKDSKCQMLFWRANLTPILSGKTRYGRDSAVLARALDLKPVMIADRRGGDPALMLAKIANIEEVTLERQLATIDARIADPTAKIEQWDTRVVANRPEALASRAAAIMTGIERAAAITGNDRFKARDSGRILARLLALLPRDSFVGFRPRVLAVYAKADDQHWLWEAEPLIRRLGDLGVDAVPYLIAPRASGSSVNAAGIEGLCRVGEPGRHLAEPALLTMWAQSRDGLDRNARTVMFVAMRRMGITPPPLPEDKQDLRAALELEWEDISPASPSRVCAVRAEQQARREEGRNGERRTNLE